MPTSVQGLASLANERIEDAIARGQFKNLPRGKVIERDHNASSPFIDTTEYLMNKIIQKQDIVPPWIEKQQELAKAVAVFRGRLRADWKRHAARVIASAGGSLQDQVKRAERYAEAEKRVNPRKSAAETAESLQASTLNAPSGSETVTEGMTAVTGTDPVASASAEPFRDPSYLLAEMPYHTLSVTNLNSLTRSYNLMAPDLAKKPYFTLERELNACFADVAPLLPQEIRDRARTGVKRVEEQGHRPGGVMERFAGRERAKVYDDRRRPYGFKEFWRDVWGRADS